HVPVSVNGSTSHAVIVDTGSPVTALDPLVFVDARRTPDGLTPTVRVGEVVIRDLAPIRLSPCAPDPCPDESLNGLLGADALMQMPTTLDYREGRIVVGGGSFDADSVDPAAVIAFRPAGGSLFVPATRIVVPVIVEGTMRLFVVDTGATFTFVSAALYR